MTRILYIEDDQELARETARYLGSLGLEVHVLPRAELAVADLDRIKPSVVVVSLATGVVVADEIRRRHHGPVIVIRKPVDVRELLRAIRTHPD